LGHLMQQWEKKMKEISMTKEFYCSFCSDIRLPITRWYFEFQIARPMEVSTKLIRWKRNLYAYVSSLKRYSNNHSNIILNLA
jgi:hypothetical protein